MDYVLWTKQQPHQVNNLITETMKSFSESNGPVVASVAKTEGILQAKMIVYPGFLTCKYIKELLIDLNSNPILYTYINTYS